MPLLLEALELTATVAGALKLAPLVGDVTLSDGGKTTALELSTKSSSNTALKAAKPAPSDSNRTDLIPGPLRTNVLEATSLKALMSDSPVEANSIPAASSAWADHCGWVMPLEPARSLGRVKPKLC